MAKKTEAKPAKKQTQSRPSDALLAKVFKSNQDVF